MERRVVPLSRSCKARLVPTGDPIELPAGSFVTLTQNLGGTFTVVANGQMARVEGEDADALGLEPITLTFPAPADERVRREDVMTALRSVYDPEIPVNIVDLGLIYEVAIDGSHVHVRMTLTAPGCGMGPVLVKDVELRVRQAPNVDRVSVELVFDPPWSRDRMSEEAQLEMGLF